MCYIKELWETLYCINKVHYYYLQYAESLTVLSVSCCTTLILLQCILRISPIPEHMIRTHTHTRTHTHINIYIYK